VRAPPGPDRAVFTFVKRALCPPASDDKANTSLTLTDILFGLVISQLFVRLPHWATLPTVARLQLVVGVTLVLGSWIGYRRSLNRSKYDVKFFNLQFFRFVIDQAMILFYFRIAILIPNSAHPHVAPGAVTQATIKAVWLVFLFYLAWDVGAIAMGLSPKYPKALTDWVGFAITVVFASAFTILYVWGTSGERLAGDGVTSRLALTIGLVLLYRWLKEVKTSWKETGTKAVAAPTAAHRKVKPKNATTSE
jgi:hypothetical protein